MEQAGKLLSKPGSLVRKSNEEIATSETFSAVELLRQEGVPEWEIALAQLAQDKRHDLPEEMFRWWREKLSQYRDSEIREALLSWAGKLFPSTDEIVAIINFRNEVKAAAKNNQSWDEYKRQQDLAEAEGRLATDEDYERLKARCREIMAKAPVITAAGRPHGTTSRGTVEAVQGKNRAIENQVVLRAGDDSRNIVQHGETVQDGLLDATSQA